MGNRIGIVGGGQLGRMMISDAKRLGFEITVIDPIQNSPANQLGANQIIAALTDEKATRELAANSDFLTFEIEHINTDVLRELQKKGIKVNPSPETLDTIKDKLSQKKFLKKNGIPTSQFEEIKETDDILRVAKKFGYPFLLKSCFGGYDGRGNFVVRKKSDIDNAIKKFDGREIYAEKFVSFQKELAIMVARSMSGEIVTYPVVETIHKNNICHIVLAPAPIEKSYQLKAANLAKKTMKLLGGAGVFGIEMFLTTDGKVLINEIAPRVHNSGHYTIEACTTSQFEQHIRAITGLPLGSTKMVVPFAVMINILGDRVGKANIAGLESALKIPNVGVHIYGKEETKFERKMGHITVSGATLEKTLKNAKLARRLISI